MGSRVRGRLYASVIVRARGAVQKHAAVLSHHSCMLHVQLCPAWQVNGLAPLM